MDVYSMPPISAKQREKSNWKLANQFQRSVWLGLFLEAHASLGLVLSVTESVWVSECHTFVKVFKIC